MVVKKLRVVAWSSQRAIVGPCVGYGDLCNDTCGGWTASYNAGRDAAPTEAFT